MAQEKRCSELEEKQQQMQIELDMNLLEKRKNDSMWQSEIEMQKKHYDDQVKLITKREEENKKLVEYICQKLLLAKQWQNDVESRYLAEMVDMVKFKETKESNLPEVEEAMKNTEELEEKIKNIAIQKKKKKLKNSMETQKLHSDDQLESLHDFLINKVNILSRAQTMVNGELEEARKLAFGTLDANLLRIAKGVVAEVATDDFSTVVVLPNNQRLQVAGAPIGSLGNGFALNLRLTSSAHHLSTMVQNFVEDISPLTDVELAGRTLDGLCNNFEGYVGLLLKAMRALGDAYDDLQNDNPLRDRISSTTQELAVLGNAVALADELLPLAASKLVPFSSMEESFSARKGSNNQSPLHIPDLMDWRRRLQGEVDNLKDHFCQLHTRDLLFNWDGQYLLDAETYFRCDLEDEDTTSQFPDRKPSAVLRGFFTHLNHISQTAAVVLPGMERIVTDLLMQFTETFANIFSEEDFWDTDPFGRGKIKILGRKGLKQFVLNMQFVIHASSHVCCCPRNLQQIVSGNTSRAMNVYAKTGTDPAGVLPDDEWFSRVAREALQNLRSVYGLN